jgi:hypothetical protein
MVSPSGAPLFRFSVFNAAAISGSMRKQQSCFGMPMTLYTDLYRVWYGNHGSAVAGGGRFVYDVRVFGIRHEN